MSNGLVKYIKKLIEEVSENVDYWQIVDVVEIEEVTKDNIAYCKIKGEKENRLYRKQDDEFIIQWCGCCEDDYSGYILKPINKTGKYLKISYGC